jgi:hypothetical protein
MFSAVIWPKLACRVVRIRPASINSPTSVSNRPCSPMSAVWKRARVNMNSQCSPILLGFSLVMSNGRAGFPGGNRRQRHRGRFGKPKFFRLATNNPLIDALKLSVAAGAIDRTSIENLVARSKKRGLCPDSANDPGRVPTKYFQVSSGTTGPPPRILASTGLMPTARISTNKSRAAGSGFSAFRSKKLSGSEIGKGLWKPNYLHSPIITSPDSKS